MSDKSQRREPRIDIALPIKLKLPDGQFSYQSSNASWRGIFIACAEPLPLGKLVRFSTTLGPSEEPLHMLGLVAHTVNSLEAQESGRAAGMGVQLYSIGRETRAQWREFISAEYEKDPEARDQARAIKVPRVPLRLRSLEQLRTFATRDLKRGNIFIRTSTLHPADSEVICEVQHPKTEEIIELGAKVLSIKEAPRRERGMRLEFSALSADKQAEFDAFAEDLPTAQAPETDQSAESS